MYLSALTLLSSTIYRDPRRDLRQILIDRLRILADSVSMSKTLQVPTLAEIEAEQAAISRLLEEIHSELSFVDLCDLVRYCHLTARNRELCERWSRLERAKC